eukprot:333445-Pyramimonas_sp.AAC.2
MRSPPPRDDPAALPPVEEAPAAGAEGSAGPEAGAPSGPWRLLACNLAWRAWASSRSLRIC